MARIRYGNLAAKYDASWSDYQNGGWLNVDQALRTVVRANSSGQLPEIFTKVVVIDGAYRSQLARTYGTNARTAGQRTDYWIAQQLRRNDARITKALAPLANARSLRLQSLTHVVEAHGVIVDAISAAAPGSRVAHSFASKYLHFHNAIFPIFDNIVKYNVARFTSWNGYGAAFQGALTVAQSAPHADPVYAHHVAKVFVILEHIKGLAPPSPVTVKGVDHMLILG
jgi:hypothetical protein